MLNAIRYGGHFYDDDDVADCKVEWTGVLHLVRWICSQFVYIICGAGAYAVPCLAVAHMKSYEY